MTTGDFRVFVSAVSSEFGKARSAVASDLRSRELFVKVEEDFRQESGADTMLRKLHNYIRDCSAVVCIVGGRSGTLPTEAETEPFQDLLPEGVERASYTQWEFYFARHHKRRLSLFVAEGHAPERPVTSADDANLQESFRNRIIELGIDREIFTGVDELRWRILRGDWTHSRRPKPIVLPYPSIGALFAGREGFLRMLRENLSQSAPTAIVSHTLYGLGGIGKTRTAVEYAWSNRERYTALLFVVAETPETLRRNLAALSAALVPKLEVSDDSVRLQSVLDWLQANPGWLLILDNVDTQDALLEVERLLGSLSGGHVVVTSRLADFSASFRSIEMDVLGLDAAATFLLARTEGRRRKAADDGIRAREVAAELGQLALALEQAAALIAKGRLTFADYLQHWQAKRNEALSWFDATITGYPRSVAVTWQTSVAQLGESGRRLLDRLAWLSSERIPEFLIDEPVSDTNLSLREALNDLAAYSLVARDADGPYFLIHRLVQDVTRRSLAGETEKLSLMEALDWIGIAFNGDPLDASNWPRLDPLTPHAQAVTSFADQAGIKHPTALLMGRIGSLMSAKALFAEADPILHRAVAIGEAAYSADDPRLATLLTRFGVFLQSTGQYKRAESMMRRALEIDENAFGRDAPHVAVDLNNLATLLHDLGRTAEAVPLMQRALTIDESNYPADHPHIAIRLSNLGEFLKVLGQFGEAEPLMRRALAIHTKHNGSSDPAVATDLANLSVLLYYTNRLDEAERLVRRALEIDESRLGTDHPHVALRLEILAQVLQARQLQLEAEPLMRRSLAINEKVYGPEHPSVAQSLNNLARLLSIRQPMEAVSLLRRAVAINEKVYGPEHPAVGTSLDGLAAVLHATGRRAEAISFAQRALAVAEKVSGPVHPDVATSLNNLSTLLLAEGRFDEAEPLSRRSVAILVEFSRRTRQIHPHLDRAIQNYRHLLQQMRKSRDEMQATVADLLAPLSS